MRRRTAAKTTPSAHTGGVAVAAEDVVDGPMGDAVQLENGCGGGDVTGGCAQDVCEEDDEGSVEYKLKLVDPPLDRLEHLFTQVAGVSVLAWVAMVGDFLCVVEGRAGWQAHFSFPGFVDGFPFHEVVRTASPPLCHNMLKRSHPLSLWRLFDVLAVCPTHSAADDITVSPLSVRKMDMPPHGLTNPCVPPP